MSEESCAPSRLRYWVLGLLLGIGLLVGVVLIGLRILSGEPKLEVRVVGRTDRDSGVAFRVAVTNVGSLRMYHLGLVTIQSLVASNRNSVSCFWPPKPLDPGQGYLMECEFPDAGLPELAQTNRLILHFERPSILTWLNSTDSRWDGPVAQFIRRLPRAAIGVQDTYITNTAWVGPGPF